MTDHVATIHARAAELQDHLDALVVLAAGSSRDGRYAVLSEQRVGTRMARIFSRCNSKDRAGMVASSHLEDGYTPAALYDLKELGRQCFYKAGDVVTCPKALDPSEHLYVVRAALDFTRADDTHYPVGQAYQHLWLDYSSNRENREDDDCQVQNIDSSEVVAVTRVDHQYPVRYALAGVRTIVMFDSVPS